MNTNNAFKSLIFIPLIASLIFATSCSTDSSNDINALQEQITTLEEQMIRMEENTSVQRGRLSARVADLESENQALKDSEVDLETCINALINRFERLLDVSIDSTTQTIGRDGYGGNRRTEEVNTSSIGGSWGGYHAHDIRNYPHTHDAVISTRFFNVPLQCTK